MRLVPVLPLVLIVAGLAAAQEPGPAALVKDLESDNAKTSQIAEFELVKAGSDAVPLLLSYLRDERRDMRLRVVKMFGRMGADAKEARASLDKLLVGEDRGMANLAARSLVRIDPHHDAAVQRLMKSPGPLSRLVLSRSLARGGASVMPHLQKLAKDQHKGVRESAGRALVEVAAGCKAEIAGPVLLLLLDNESFVVRRAAIAGLASMSDPPRRPSSMVSSRPARVRLSSPASLASTSSSRNSSWWTPSTWVERVLRTPGTRESSSRKSSPYSLSRSRSGPKRRTSTGAS